MLHRTKKEYDTSSELVIQRFGPGIKLIRPEKVSSSLHENMLSVDKMLSMPLNVYFVNRQSVLQNLNKETQENAGFDSIQSAVGKTVAIAATKETTKITLDHDQTVFRTSTMQIRDEIYTRLIDNLQFTSINAKLPWFDNENKIIGVFGFSIILSADENLTEKCSLTASFSKIFEMIMPYGLLNSDPCPRTNTLTKISPGTSINDIYFTKRQSEIINELLKGKTSKEIGKILGLSNRTVEFYISNIKDKMNVNTKSQLLEKIFEFQKMPNY